MPKKVTAKKTVRKKAPAKTSAGKNFVTKKAAPGGAAPGVRLIPPKNGATVRMYRTGHGDCFLVAFPGSAPDRPAYVLIDCGYKPGSNGEKYINVSIREITKNIREATGGHIDVAVITHEHQDHVNGITRTNFEGITIGEAWFAWTEDPTDDLANELRKKFKDKLLGLVAARNRLAADGDRERVKRIDEFLAFELGGDERTPFTAARATQWLGAAAAGGQSMNKQSMKLFKDLASKNGGVKFIRPHEKILCVPGCEKVRVFALGPPRDADQIADLDPQGDESFPAMALSSASAGNYFAAAVTAAASANGPAPPFANRYCIPQKSAMADSNYGDYLTRVYGKKGSKPSLATGVVTPGRNEVAGNEEWRRIDKDWLYSADQLALAMNDQTNNASLVLAFELEKGGKVLLFAADAQRGNWASWSKKSWKDDKKIIKAKDLLARTVLYKVGHHGSHNATLNGTVSDEHANLSWIAQGDYASEFTAMITAVRKWAETQVGWDHPQKAIKDALMKKACGRVFQTDCLVDAMKTAGNGPVSEWKAFLARTDGQELYFDYTVMA